MVARPYSLINLFGLALFPIIMEARKVQRSHRSSWAHALESKTWQDKPAVDLIFKREWTTDKRFEPHAEVGGWVPRPGFGNRRVYYTS